MKQIFFYAIILALLAPLGVSAQNSDSTSDNSPSSYTDPIANTIPQFALNPADVNDSITGYLNSKLTSYQVYNFDYTALNTYLLGNKYALEFTLNDGTNSTLLTLQRQDMRADNYVESTTDENGNTTNTFERTFESDSLFVVRTLKGSANHDKTQIARFGIYEDNFAGYVYNTETNHILYYTSLQDFIKSNGNDFSTSANYLLVFDLGAVITDKNSTCIALQTANTSGSANKGSFDLCTPRFLEIAAEGDKKWCDMYGGSAASKIMQDLFLVEGLYTVNFNISFIINNISLLSTNASLYNTTNPNTMLSQFQSNWNTNHTSVPRDMTLLFTGRALDYPVLGIAYVDQLCYLPGAYAVISNNSKLSLVTAHEMGHIFGSYHDDGVGGYGTSACVNPDVPIMCSAAVSNGPAYYFSPYTRNIILNSINAHAGCLNDHANGTAVNTIIKSWSNNRNLRWVASWYLNNGDYKVAGNFDGLDNDEEIFFASPNNQWVGIMDFSCDQGTDWYHMWGNSGNGSFGTWIRNSGDKYMAGDFDGNGKSDLLSISGGASWAALQEYSPSTWSWTHKWGNSGTHWISYWHISQNDTYVIGDFDGDGHDELLCTNPNGWSQLIKFNWMGTYYNPQTIWSNNGSGWVGGVQIGNTNRWLKGKFATTSKDELFTISGTWVTTQRFNGSSWDWIWSQYGASNFASMYILPLGSNEVTMTGNVDADNVDEFVDLNKTWSATADYNGSTYTQNWNNGGTQYLNDWHLNETTDYFLIKAATTSNKQIFGTKYDHHTSGWWFWETDYWDPSLAAMYRTNSAIQNFRQTSPSTAQAAQNSNIKVYPNPANDFIIIEVAGDPAISANITDMSGRIVATQDLKANSNKMPLQNLPAGTYLLNVQTEKNSSLSYKILVNGH